ncbi:ParB/RepB/Spo0J family partition protein [bacterium]|nr:ParB/RepB/Spo0J family partition protein [bacterium]
MTIDRNFTPCQAENNDELYPNGIFVFNITKMLQHIQSNANEFELAEIEIKDFQEVSSSLNESHIDSVDISQPAIIAEISPGGYNLIDGHHRLEKAKRIANDKILTYKLNVDQHIVFLTDRDACVPYVNYWNSKISMN